MALDIRIPDPCTQRLEDLEPSADGTLLCTRCHQHLIDFRGMSDDEVALAHALAGGRICGVYDEAQLRADTPRRAPTPPRLVTLALGATLLSGTVAAQSASPPATATVQTPQSRPGVATADVAATAPSPAPADTFVVRGTVRDEEGKPLTGVNVMVVGETVLRTLTDSLGAYALRLGERPAGQRITLRFVQLGRNPVFADVPAGDPTPRVDATLKPSTVEMEGIIIPTAARRSILSRLLSIFR